MRYLVTGGCGFIGSHVVRRLLLDTTVSAVVVVDNLLSGSMDRLGPALADRRVDVVISDVKDLDRLTVAATGVDHVFHFAANPDIAKSMVDPTIDFWEGTYLTQNVLEAIRIAGVRRLTYASGSGVYGDRSHLMPDEAFGPLEPVSTYGASKLGCEALISSYCHMFGLASTAFRFANVVGDRQTHGVTYDFVRKLRADPRRLEILGDGEQEKSYIHVDDVVSAMLHAQPTEIGSFAVFNVTTGDVITVNRIAELVIEELGLEDVELARQGEARGWRGDVPVVRFDDSRLRALGWTHQMTSEQAIRSSIRSNLAETAPAL